MRVIHIVPLCVPQRFLQTQQQQRMLLTHLVEDSLRYREQLLEDDITDDFKYRILDNSLIELGGAVSLERLLKAAEIAKPHEIILPDVFRDGVATLAVAKEYIEYLKTREMLGRYKLMVVCQGKDAREFVETYRALERIPEVDVIGIPKVCAKMLATGRPGFEYLWRDTPQEIHLLGLWYSWEELERYKHPEHIRSVDSCLAAFQCLHRLPPSAVRPDGVTIDLQHDTVDIDRLWEHLQRIRQMYPATRG